MQFSPASVFNSIALLHLQIQLYYFTAKVSLDKKWAIRAIKELFLSRITIWMVRYRFTLSKNLSFIYVHNNT